MSARKKKDQTKRDNGIEKISDAEWNVMHVVWNRGSVTAQEVIDEVVPETGWSPNTVRTLLIRLTDKGILHVEKRKGKEKDYQICYYTAIYSREQCTAKYGSSFLRRVFQGDATRLLAHFVKDARLTPEQVDELRKQLDEFSE